MEELTQSDIDFINESLEQGTTNANDIGSYEIVNGVPKLKRFSYTKSDKLRAFSLLTKCNYKTSPREIFNYLEIIFSDCGSKDGHWLFIAQHYTVKTICAVLREIIRKHQRSEVTILNAGKFFTSIIKKKKKRKLFRKIEEEKAKEKEAKE